MFTFRHYIEDPPKWTKKSGSTENYPRTEVRSDYLLLSVLHFTEYLTTINGLLMKKMKMASYVMDVYDDSDQEIRVYLHNDTPKEQQVMNCCMNDCDYVSFTEGFRGRQILIAQ